jgi:PAS domain S-box-containing protein
MHRIFSQLASDYVYIVDLSNPTLFPEIVGGSFERTTGLTPSEVQAKGGWLSIIHPEDHASMMAIIPTLMEGKPSINEYRITDGSGHIRWLRDAVHPAKDPVSGKVVRLMGGVQDITERKRLEEQLLQAQKLEAVARLSGGIAHDFNNLLSVIMGSVAMLEMEVKSDSARESCNAIMEASVRGADLTRAMLVFSRRDAGTPRLVNLAEVVRDAMPMLARAVGPRISWKLVGGDAPVLVRIDAGQAQLLLLNLAINARDAMPDGGCITIALHSQTYGSGDELPGELDHGPYVRVSISDEGVGIAPEILSRVFEPFFTTKAHGKGTGLGLAACQNVVGHANGAIQVKSLVGKGTTFTIFLPLCSGEKSKTITSLAHHSPGGMERILLVEDEKPLQDILVRNLRDRGYTVTSVDSAEDAIIKIGSEPFALLITDLVLPRMHGSELVRQARIIQPNLLVLCISGYPGDVDLPKDI